jgi:biofilm PGA synthesis N-glycosyltransferase PgaC
MKVIGIMGYFVLLYPICMVVIWMVGGLLFRVRWENRRQPVFKEYPPVTILVPAHNEEKVIRETVEGLRGLAYPSYEVIVVDDGSSDGTPVILDELVRENGDWLRVVHVRPNKGKARALNEAIPSAKGDFILVVDADCLLDNNALRFLIHHLVSSPNVGAVTGNPRVRNRTTLLGKIQVGEYSYIIGLIKRAQRIYGKILTVSGAITAFRKSALFDVGLFDPDTVTEDIDITWKLHRKSWEVRYEPRALCWVLVPETVKGLWRQRVRWAQGGVEALKKHARVLIEVRHRRLWPIYMEYLFSTVWAHAFIFIFLLLSLSHGVGLVHTLLLAPGPAAALALVTDSLVPDWAESRAVLAMLCLGQFLVSLVVDFRYERPTAIMKIYFWIVWYPAAYWLISSLSCIAGVYKVITRRSKICAAWQSPDRGIHTLRSSKDRS